MTLIFLLSTLIDISAALRLDCTVEFRGFRASACYTGSGWNVYADCATPRNKAIQLARGK